MKDLKSFSQEMIKKADADAVAEISPGFYLVTGEEMVLEQKDWGGEDEDAYFHIDFSSHSYWLHNDCGMEPDCIDTVEGLEDYLEDIGFELDDDEDEDLMDS